MVDPMPGLKRRHFSVSSAARLGCGVGGWRPLPVHIPIFFLYSGTASAAGARLPAGGDTEPISLPGRGGAHLAFADARTGAIAAWTAPSRLPSCPGARDGTFHHAGRFRGAADGTRAWCFEFALEALNSRRLSAIIWVFAVELLQVFAGLCFVEVRLSWQFFSVMAPLASVCAAIAAWSSPGVQLLPSCAYLSFSNRFDRPTGVA